jgi:hypothetical protein
MRRRRRASPASPQAMRPLATRTTTAPALIDIARPLAIMSAPPQMLRDLTLHADWFGSFFNWSDDYSEFNWGDA